MEWFAHCARRLGQTEQPLARSLIEREARSEQTWQTLEDSSSRMRDRLRRIGNTNPPRRSLGIAIGSADLVSGLRFGPAGPVQINNVANMY